MTSGTYQVLDLAETFERMPEVSLVLRPILDAEDPTDQEHPFLAAIGPLTVSSDHSLVRRADLPIWDVNGYYRALGIEHPTYGLTRGDLRRAYQRVDGQSDEYATYSFKRLLDQEFRDFYDGRELGRPVDDLYGWLIIQRRSALWAARETLRTGEVHEAKQFIPEDIRKQMETAAKGEKPPPRKVSYVASNNSVWAYGYYLWGTRKRDDMALSIWQEMLIEAFWAKRLRISFAVGYVGSTSSGTAVRYRLTHPDAEVIFLHENADPSPELADVVVGTYYNVPRVTTAEPLHIQADFSTTRPHEANQPKEQCMTEETELDFSTGAQEAEQYVKDQAEARKAARGGANWFSLKNDGDMALLRFLIPDTRWIYVKQHDFLKPKAAPSDKPSDRDWPRTVGTICRYTLIGQKENRRPAYDECYACDSMKNEKGKKEIASTKIWTLAAGRVSVVGNQELVDQGRIHESQIGQKINIDEAELVDEFDANGNKTGKQYWRTKIYIVNQSVRNFFSPLTTIAKLQGSITDQDFAIVRKGEKGSNQVDYEAIPLGKIPVQVPKLDGSGELETITYDTIDPRIAALYEGHGISEQDLRKIINRRISKSYYDFFLDPRGNVAWKDFYKNNEDDDASPAAAATPSPEQQAGNVATAEPTQGVPQERLAALRQQVMATAGAAPVAAPVAAPLPGS